MKGEEELKSLEPLPPEIGWMDADHTFCQFFAQLGLDGCCFVFLVDRDTWDRFRDQTPDKHDMDKETGLFRLYPDSLISEKTEGKVYRIVLEAKESR